MGGREAGGPTFAKVSGLGAAVVVAVDRGDTLQACDRGRCGRCGMVMAIAMVVAIRGAAAVVRSPSLTVKRVHESHIVETADMMEIPKLHRIDFLGIPILADGLLVDVGDRLHSWIELRLEDRGQAAVCDRRLLQGHLPAP